MLSQQVQAHAATKTCANADDIDSELPHFAHANHRLVGWRSDGMLRPPRCSHPEHAAQHPLDGALDPKFGNGGLANIVIPVPTNVIVTNDLLVQSNGQPVALGYFRQTQHTQVFVQRLLNDGGVDKSFAGSGTLVLASPDGTPDSSDVPAGIVAYTDERAAIAFNVSTPTVVFMEVVRVWL